MGRRERGRQERREARREEGGSEGGGGREMDRKRNVGKVGYLDVLGWVVEGFCEGVHVCRGGGASPARPRG